MVQIKLLIQAENIYVGRMLLHSVLLLFRMQAIKLQLRAEQRKCNNRVQNVVARYESVTQMIC